MAAYKFEDDFETFIKKLEKANVPKSEIKKLKGLKIDDVTFFADTNWNNIKNNYNVKLSQSNINVFKKVVKMNGAFFVLGENPVITVKLLVSSKKRKENGSAKNPTTQQQERVTAAIFEEILSKHTPDVKTFEDLIDRTLLKEYPDIRNNKSWYKSFELQFNQIKKETKLPDNTFDVFNRDGGFMDYITKLVNSGKSDMTYAKKDSWNPADIWLINSSKVKPYEKLLDNAVDMNQVNDILREAFNKNIIVGISLKKNDGKKLSYDLVNIESNEKLPDLEYEAFNLNIPYDANIKEFTSLTSGLVIKSQGKKYTMGIKSNQRQIGNITYEFSGGGAAFLGKVPKDVLEHKLKSYGYYMPVHTMYTKFDRSTWESKISKISNSSIKTVINGSLKDFVDNLEQSWAKGRSKDNVIIMQIVDFCYIMSVLNKKQLEEFKYVLFYSSQKKGKGFGPFAKLH